MTLAALNPSPRFAAHLATLLVRDKNGFCIADIGARGGLDDLWAPIAEVARFVGFEADETEAATLTKDGSANLVICHRAVADRDGRQEFHVTKFPWSSGFYRCDPDWTGRFPITEQDVVKSVVLETVRLDTFAAEAGLDHIDFLKIDTEGSELDVLRGASDQLARGDILGIKTECWWDPIQKGQPSFAEMDEYLRQNGFLFFDLKLRRHPRNTLPSGRITARFDNAEAKAKLGYRQLEYGQALTGDALYFRDPVWDALKGRNLDGWTPERLLRLCGLLDIFDYGDAAIEILEHFRDRVATAANIDDMIDLLVPDIDEQILPYDEFLGISRRVRQDYRKRTLGLEDWVPPETSYRKP